MRQWADHTTAFYIPFYRVFDGLNIPPRCGCTLIRKDFLRHHGCRCNTLMRADILCEFDAKPHERDVIVDTTTTVNMPLRVSPSFPFPHVKCLTGFVTHTFLACEKNCFGDSVFTESERWGVPESSSCYAPLTSLPPSFLCNNGGQRVSYTVICDFRSDCTDSSDEDFCTFQPCPTRTHHPCDSSQQVTSCEAVKE